MPAMLILVLPLAKVPIRWAMAASALSALLVAVLVQGMPLTTALRDAVLGYVPAEGALFDVLSGGGVVSMVSATLLAISTSLYAGLLGGMGALDGARHWAGTLARRWGRFPACTVVCVASGMVFCNQSTAPMVAEQLLGDVYQKEGNGQSELALDIENSGIVLAPLIPWNISVSIPLAMLDASPAALPFAVLLYVLPLTYGLTKKHFYHTPERSVSP